MFIIMSKEKEAADYTWVGNYLLCPTLRKILFQFLTYFLSCESIKHVLPNVTNYDTVKG